MIKKILKTKIKNIDLLLLIKKKEIELSFFSNEFHQKRIKLVDELVFCLFYKSYLIILANHKIKCFLIILENSILELIDLELDLRIDQIDFSKGRLFCCYKQQNLLYLDNLKVFFFDVNKKDGKSIFKIVEVVDIEESEILKNNHLYLRNDVIFEKEKLMFFIQNKAKNENIALNFNLKGGKYFFSNFVYNLKSKIFYIENNDFIFFGDFFSNHLSRNTIDESKQDMLKTESKLMDNHKKVKIVINKKQKKEKNERKFSMDFNELFIELEQKNEFKKILNYLPNMYHLPFLKREPNFQKIFILRNNKFEFIKTLTNCYLSFFNWEDFSIYILLITIYQNEISSKIIKQIEDFQKPDYINIEQDHICLFYTKNFKIIKTSLIDNKNEIFYLKKKKDFDTLRINNNYIFKMNQNLYNKKVISIYKHLLNSNKNNVIYQKIDMNLFEKISKVFDFRIKLFIKGKEFCLKSEFLRMTFKILLSNKNSNFNLSITEKPKNEKDSLGKLIKEFEIQQYKKIERIINLSYNDLFLIKEFNSKTIQIFQLKNQKFTLIKNLGIENFLQIFTFEKNNKLVLFLIESENEMYYLTIEFNNIFYVSKKKLFDFNFEEIFLIENIKNIEVTIIMFVKNKIYILNLSEDKFDYDFVNNLENYQIIENDFKLKNYKIIFFQKKKNLVLFHKDNLKIFRLNKLNLNIAYKSNLDICLGKRYDIFFYDKFLILKFGEFYQSLNFQLFDLMNNKSFSIRIENIKKTDFYNFLKIDVSKMILILSRLKSNGGYFQLQKILIPFLNYNSLDKYKEEIIINNFYLNQFRIIFLCLLEISVLIKNDFKNKLEIFFYNDKKILKTFCFENNYFDLEGFIWKIGKKNDFESFLIFQNKNKFLIFSILQQGEYLAFDVYLEKDLNYKFRAKMIYFDDNQIHLIIKKNTDFFSYNVETDSLNKLNLKFDLRNLLQFDQECLIFKNSEKLKKLKLFN